MTGTKPGDVRTLDTLGRLHRGTTGDLPQGSLLLQFSVSRTESDLLQFQLPVNNILIHCTCVLILCLKNLYYILLYCYAYIAI